MRGYGPRLLLVLCVSTALTCSGGSRADGHRDAGADERAPIEALEAPLEHPGEVSEVPAPEVVDALEAAPGEEPGAEDAEAWSEPPVDARSGIEQVAPAHAEHVAHPHATRGVGVLHPLVSIVPSELDARPGVAAGVAERILVGHLAALDQAHRATPEPVAGLAVAVAAGSEVRKSRRARPSV